MNKKDMIKILVEKEFELWEKNERDVEMYGIDHKYTRASRAEWYTVRQLVKELKIKEQIRMFKGKKIYLENK